MDANCRVLVLLGFLLCRVEGLSLDQGVRSNDEYATHLRPNLFAVGNNHPFRTRRNALEDKKQIIAARAGTPSQLTQTPSPAKRESLAKSHPAESLRKDKRPSRSAQGYRRLIKRNSAGGSKLKPLSWNEFTNKTMSSYKHGFPPEIKLNDLIPSKTNFILKGVAINLKNFAKYCEDDTCFWKDLYYKYIKGYPKDFFDVDGGMTMEKLSLIFVYARCTTFEGKRSYCPSPCSSKPCKNILHTVPNKCESLKRLFRNDYVCECKLGYSWKKESFTCDAIEGFSHPSAVKTPNNNNPSAVEGDDKLVDQGEETKEEEKEKGGGLNIWKIIVIVIGVILTIAIGACCVVCVRNTPNDLSTDGQTKQPLMEDTPDKQNGQHDEPMSSVHSGNVHSKHAQAVVQIPSDRQSGRDGAHSSYSDHLSHRSSDARSHRWSEGRSQRSSESRSQRWSEPRSNRFTEPPPRYYSRPNHH